MKLSSKSKYGLNAMYHIAISKSDEPLSITELSKLTNVTQPYLEKVLAILKKKELVVSTRGVMGGYKLSRPPEDITLGEILRALEKDLAFSTCANSSKCSNHKCPNKSVFRVVYEKLNNVLDEMTLLDMIEKGEF